MFAHRQTLFMRNVEDGRSPAIELKQAMGPFASVQQKYVASLRSATFSPDLVPEKNREVLRSLTNWFPTLIA